MSQELAKNDLDDGLRYWEQFSREGSREWMPRGYEMMRFDGQEGIYNRPKTDPDTDMTGEEFVADIRGIHVGWTKFVNNRPVDARIVRAPERPPLRSTLGDLDREHWETGFDGKPKDPWSEGIYLPLYGREDGAPFIFVTSSQSGIRAVRSLSGDFATKWKEKGEPNRLPIVKLDKEKFKSRFGSKLFAPIFCIVAWRKMDAGEMVGDARDRKAIEAPAKPSERRPDLADREHQRRGRATAQSASGKVVDKRRRESDRDDFDAETDL